jgi:branched-chain amino acid aminotransferase
MQYYNGDTMMFVNGAFVKAADVRVDFFSQTLHYGYGVFEGIRSYRCDDGSARIFKAVEHFERLMHSAQALNLPYKFDNANLIEATYELLDRNALTDAYIRPLVVAPANMSFSTNEDSDIIIAVWKMEPFLGEKLLRVKTSSLQRPNPGAFNMRVKATGHYVNSIMASQEVKSKGYDEALLTDTSGFLAEAPGANLFFEKDGKLFTPAEGHILPGITRATVFEICHELGISVEHGRYKLEDLYKADAAFFCGTAAEIIGFESIDDRKLNMNWTETLSSSIRKAYLAKVRERDLIPEPIEAANNI